MPKRKRHRVQSEISVGTACQLFETVLGGGGMREEILDAIQRGGDFADSLSRLRGAMRSHVFPTRGTSVALGRVVVALDNKTRSEGFHVLQSWDYQAERFSELMTPVLMLDRCASVAQSEGRERAILSVLLDQYFLALFGLLAVRAWDDDDPDAIFDRVTRLSRTLQGRADEGRRFVDDAETLLLLAVAHYHPNEAAYDVLLERVRELNDEHRLRLAMACAPILGSHLRWGHRFMYQRDLAVMRNDNVVDYPWLLFSLATLMHATEFGDAAQTRHDVAESLLGGLSADPWAFTGNAPPCLKAAHAEHAELRQRLLDHREQVASRFEAHRPKPDLYSPLGLSFNFLSNALVAMVATAVGEWNAHPSLNTLLVSPDNGASPEARRYARALMAFACGGADPSGTPGLIMYDPYEGQHAFNMTVHVVREA